MHSIAFPVTSLDTGCKSASGNERSVASFEESLLNHSQTGILFSFQDYVSLVDWTGRVIRSDKRDHVYSYLPPILNCLPVLADQRTNVPLN
jgi:hypothetical protein